MKELNLTRFFHGITNDRKNTFDSFTISRFLSYARILDSKSKHAIRDRLVSYYEQPEFDRKHILRFMDILEENYDTYLTWL